MTELTTAASREEKGTSLYPRNVLLMLDIPLGLLLTYFPLRILFTGSSSCTPNIDNSIDCIWVTHLTLIVGGPHQRVGHN